MVAHTHTHTHTHKHTYTYTHTHTHTQTHIHTHTHTAHLQSTKSVVGGLIGGGEGVDTGVDEVVATPAQEDGVVAPGGWKQRQHSRLFHFHMRWGLAC